MNSEVPVFLFPKLYKVRKLEPVLLFYIVGVCGMLDPG